MTVAIVTPWLGNEHLWDDYAAVIDDARPDELLIIDNGSDPPLGFATRRLTTNRGFVGGSNHGLEAATSDVVVFLNNDVALGEGRGWLDRILDAVAPGTLAGTRLRSDYHCFVDGRVLPYLDGWCLAGMRTDLLELGGFDRTLEEPAYYSDNLLCLEARARGFTLREVATGLVHKEGQTIRPDENPDARVAGVANRQRYEQRARELLASTTKGA